MKWQFAFTVSVFSTQGICDRRKHCMRIRTVAVIGCLLLSAALANITAAPNLFLTLESVGEVVISVDPSLHQEYGLAYPVTYKFGIPAGSANLVAYQNVQRQLFLPVSDNYFYRWFPLLLEG
jgi:hypothetical protein